MKANTKKIKGSQIVEVWTPPGPTTNKKKVLELGFEVTINLPIEKVLEYRQISIGVGVLQYLVDFLNGENQKSAKRINLSISQFQIADFMTKNGIPIPSLEDINNTHHIEININRFENIYQDGYVEINGDYNINIATYIHILKHAIHNSNAYGGTIKQIDVTHLSKVFGFYQYLIDNLKFEITGQMRFKKISAHEAKVVLINPEKIKWNFNNTVYTHEFQYKMNDPFVNKLGSFST